MSAWNDQDRWAGLCSGATCPICLRTQPHDVIATWEASWVTMAEQAAPMPGYVCLVSRIHAVELHDLSPEAACTFMSDASKVSRALALVTGALKLNYEIHGNSIPHLHMHFYPRFRGDAFEGRPIDQRSVIQPVYAPGQFEGIRVALIEALRSGRR
jgi:diadenosine tetraphosphate (Ap4A) HIT family hydrolase